MPGINKAIKMVSRSLRRTGANAKSRETTLNTSDTRREKGLKYEEPQLQGMAGGGGGRLKTEIPIRELRQLDREPSCLHSMEVVQRAGRFLQVS